MKKYFAETAYMTAPRNLAEKSVQEHAQSLTATLIFGDESKHAFVEAFKTKVEEINQQFPRCRNMSAYLWSHGFDELSDSLIVEGVSRIDFKQVKHEFPENNQ